MLVEGSEALDAAALEALGEAIATCSARVDVAEHALLTKLAVFDAHEAWFAAGFLSCAQWLAWRTGVGPAAARDPDPLALRCGSCPESTRCSAAAS